MRLLMILSSLTSNLPTDSFTRALAGIVIVLSLALAVVAIPKWQVKRDLAADRITQSEIPQRVDAYRRTIVQIAGGVVVAIGLYLTWRRIQVTEEGQVTDRFSTAIEQLGDESLEVRLGGIYALERIAKDSPKDHWTVMEALAAFVRERSSSTEDDHSTFLETDIQAACTVLGRRDVRQDRKKKRIHLYNSEMSGALLHDRNLSGFLLMWSDMSYSILTKADLSRAHLTETNLRGSSFNEADLSGAKLEGAELTDAKNLNVDQLCSTETLKGATLDPELEQQVKEQCPEKLGEDSGETN